MFLMVQFILISKKCGIWDLVEADTKVNFIIASNKYLTTIQLSQERESHVVIKYLAKTTILFWQGDVV